jgi:hypothetical protein
MLNIAWAIIVETGLLRDQVTVKDMDAAREAVWSAYRASGASDPEVEQCIAQGLDQAATGTPYESTLVRLALTRA